MGCLPARGVRIYIYMYIYIYFLYISCIQAVLLLQCSSTVPTLFGLHFQLVTPISPGFSDEPLVQDRIGWLAVLLSLSGPRSYMGVNPKIVGFYHKSSIFNRVFHYKPSILGYPYFWKHPYGVQPDIRVENKIQ